ncbi:hypothetical protein ABPG74_017895 [Tetrahymena malaccensis]
MIIQLERVVNLAKGKQYYYSIKAEKHNHTNSYINQLKIIAQILVVRRKNLLLKIISIIYQSQKKQQCKKFINYIDTHIIFQIKNFYCLKSKQKGIFSHKILTTHSLSNSKMKQTKHSILQYQQIIQFSTYSQSPKQSQLKRKEKAFEANENRMKTLMIKLLQTQKYKNNIQNISNQNSFQIKYITKPVLIFIIIQSLSIKNYINQTINTN